MKLRIGIDVGGTFTDFLVTQVGAEPRIFKVLSTPRDPSLGLLKGLDEIASCLNITLMELAKATEVIVHGTTVTTNAVLTESGAKTGLLTTKGVRDALEMRRGIREEQYNNRYTNVTPLVARYLRVPISGRLNYCGKTLEPLCLEDIKQAVKLFKQEGVSAVAVCFMNSFANPEQERRAAELLRQLMPEAYLTVSSELLPSIRFYDRVSTTVLNSYVGPLLSAYLDRLTGQLKEICFSGALLIMQSNGGVMCPEIAGAYPARTLLSGPAAGPQAGLTFVKKHGHQSCITVDMGGTSFDASLIRNATPAVVTDGEINRHRIALPMLDIVTVGAGGGSIGWIDEGGLLRSGPQSAGADPGPACYGQGGTKPTCTDSDLVLGYLDPEFFAGGKIKLDKKAAENAIKKHIAELLSLSLEDAAAGMYQVVNTNMAQGVREISIKRGLDPRDFPMVVAGGAGPLHACMICSELEIPLFIVPRQSSIFCAAGMLMSDLKHDFVRSFVAPLEKLDFDKLNSLLSEMTNQGKTLLSQEKIPEDKQRFILKLDCRYIKQFHEVSFPVKFEAIKKAEIASISKTFHDEHRAIFGYSLEEQGSPIELINVRVQAVGITEKPAHNDEQFAGTDASAALKGERTIYIPEKRAFSSVPIYDGHLTACGNFISGPALVEQVNTTLLISASYDCRCDSSGSFVVSLKELKESQLVEKSSVALPEQELLP